jgi:5,10-methylenetetrahydromethanopterin reductase
MTTVTNPVTRHPSVTAAAMLALAELAPRRVAIGIGPGDSALWSVGLKPATIAELRDYVVAVKALSRDEEAQWRGRSFRRTWTGWSGSMDVPIYVACAGPKGLRSAVQVADGVIVSMGFAAEDIANVRRLIDEGCAEVGRRVDELDVWWYSEVTFAGSLEEAMESGFPRFAQWLTMGSMVHKRIPEPLGPLLRELMGDRRDIGTIMAPDRARILVERARRLGVFDWIMSHAARLWGTPRDVRSRLAELHHMGAENWILYPDNIDSRKAVELLAEVTRFGAL